MQQPFERCTIVVNVSGCFFLNNFYQTIQEWHLFLLIGVILLIDILFLLPVTAVPSAILKSVLVQLPYSVSTCAKPQHCICRQE